MPRPGTYSDGIAESICRRIIGGESLRVICKDEDMPHAARVYEWLDRIPAFAEQYARARSAQTEAMLEEILDIADKPDLDPQEKRVRIDTRKWAMGKMRPSRWGDKQEHMITGPDGGPVQVITANVSDLTRQMRAIVSGDVEPAALIEQAKALAPVDEARDIL